MLNCVVKFASITPLLATTVQEPFSTSSSDVTIIFASIGESAKISGIEAFANSTSSGLTLTVIFSSFEPNSLKTSAKTDFKTSFDKDTSFLMIFFGYFKGNF